MKIKVLVLLSILFLVSSVFAQKPGDIVIMPKVSVSSTYRSKTYDNIIRDLDRLFSPPLKMSQPVPTDEVEKTSWKHGIEDTPLGFFDFGLRGKELKSLRGGFELGGMDFYLKSGIAWHPDDNRNVTWTIGRRTSWGYLYRNQHDLFQYTIRRPLEKANSILEWPITRLLGLK